MKKYFTKEFLLKCFHSFIWVSVLVFIGDIVSKWCVQSNLNVGQTVTIIPNFLFVTLVHNTGASFGMGSGGDIGWRIFWIAVSVVLGGVLIYVYKRYFAKFSTLQKVSLTLMIGGAIGNLIDRTFYWESLTGFDGVIDWISFHFGSFEFAVFNVADSCLVIGVIILIAIEIVELIKEVREKDKRGEYDIAPKVEEKKADEEHQDK